MLLPWFFLNSAEVNLPSSTTGLLLSAVPLVAVGVALAFGRRDRITAINWVGIATGMLGVAAIVGLDLGGSDLASVAMLSVVVIGYAVGPAILARWMSALPPVGVVDVVEKDIDGEMYVRLVDAAADAPRALLVPDRTGQVGPAPGMGDRLLVKFERGAEGWEARLVKMLDVGANRVLGVIRKSNKETRVEPVDRRSKDVLLIPQALAGDLRDGDLVRLGLLSSLLVGDPTSDEGSDTARAQLIFGNGRIRLKGAAIRSPGATVKLRGSIGFDGSLDLIAIPYPEFAWIQIVPGIGDAAAWLLSNTSSRLARATIRGSLGNPAVVVNPFAD